MFSEIIRNNFKKILIGFVVLALVVVVYFIFTTITRAGKVGVAVAIVPSDALTTINGQTISPGTVYLKAGQYTVKSSKDGFASFSKTQFIDDTQKTVIVSLTPESDTAKKWATDNRQKYLDNESIGGAAAEDQGVAARSKNPIINALPYSNLLYTIGYTNDPIDPSGNTIILTISAAQGYRNAAVEQIRTLGYDPTNFKIKFYDYTNPFES